MDSRSKQPSAAPRVFALLLATVCACSKANDSDTGSHAAGGSAAKSKAKGTGGHSGTGGRSSTAGMGTEVGSGTGGMTSGHVDGGSYPTLDPSMIGQPTQITIDVTPALSLSESPVWDPCEHRLLFPDVDASAIYALKDGAVTTVATNTNNSNGMGFDLDGSLILAQMGPYPGHLAKLDRSGTITVIDPPASPALHTPDDVVVRSDGTIFFTDGDFPPTGGFSFSQLPIYSVGPDRDMMINRATLLGPNGVELSPDEKTLYVDADYAGQVMKYDVADDGTLANGVPLASGLQGPDSLCLDAAGNLYVGVSGGLQVLAPDGSKIALIAVQASAVTNCTFGDDDGKTLYITAWSTMWKVEGMPIPGLDWVVDQQRVQCPSN